LRVFHRKTGTSWSKIALTNIYSLVGHPPRCTQKACYECAERQIAASTTEFRRQPVARGSGCRKRIFRIIGGFCYVRLPVSVCCPDGRRLSAGNDAVTLPAFRSRPMRQAKLARLTFWRKSSPCISTTTHISCSLDRMRSPIRSPRVSSRMEARAPDSIPSGPAFA
jgi:hypothetical protein